MSTNLCVHESCLFFFQAEDGIRDIGVTGVQTCALPISREVWPMGSLTSGALAAVLGAFLLHVGEVLVEDDAVFARKGHRSEERRVGKEGRSRGSPYH